MARPFHESHCVSNCSYFYTMRTCAYSSIFPTVGPLRWEIRPIVFPFNFFSNHYVVLTPEVDEKKANCEGWIWDVCWGLTPSQGCIQLKRCGGNAIGNWVTNEVTYSSSLTVIAMRDKHADMSGSAGLKSFGGEERELSTSRLLKRVCKACRRVGWLHS